MMTIRSKENSICCCAKQIGDFHKKSGARCEDAVFVKQYPFGTVLTVSDGVGSMRYARTAANAAVWAVRKSFEERNEGTDLTRAIERYYTERIPAKKRGSAAATCLFAVHLYGKGFWIGQAGDGLCFCRTERETIFLNEEKKEERNITYPLIPGRKADWRISFSTEQNIEIMLMTDGISEEIKPGKEGAVMDFLVENLRVKKQASQLRELLRNEIALFSSDDKAIAVYTWEK